MTVSIPPVIALSEKNVKLRLVLIKVDPFQVPDYPKSCSIAMQVKEFEIECRHEKVIMIGRDSVTPKCEVEFIGDIMHGKDVSLQDDKEILVDGGLKFFLTMNKTCVFRNFNLVVGRKMFD